VNAWEATGTRPHPSTCREGGPPHPAVQATLGLASGVVPCQNSQHQYHSQLRFTSICA